MRKLNQFLPDGVFIPHGDIVAERGAEEGAFVRLNFNLQPDEMVVMSYQSELFGGARVIVRQR